MPRHLAPSLAKALQDSGRLQLGARGTHLLVGILDGVKVTVEADGDVVYGDAPQLQALVTQCIRGILPRIEESFLVGIDEAGMGGEATNPRAAIVMISRDSRADLLASGVMDCKRVADSDLSGLTDAIQNAAMRLAVLDVPKAAAGQSQASLVAETVAAELLRWQAAGHLPADSRLTFDQTDRTALEAAFGPSWPMLQPRVKVQPNADSNHVEVAAASVLARGTTTVSPSKPRRTAELTGNFRISRHTAADRDQVLEFLWQLERSYPDIGKWIGKADDPKAIWNRIEDPKSNLYLLVARLDQQVVGFCLTQEKDARNAKLSTFFVAPRFQRQHIGHRLLDMELRRLASKGIKRVMVTFGHEEMDRMARFFREHGFTLDGISPQRYRDNSYEAVMGKRLKHGRVAREEFPAFIEHDVFRMQGYDVHHEDTSNFLATPRPTLLEGPAAKAHRVFVHVTTSPTPELELAEVRRRAQAHSAAPVLASTFGFPADIDLPGDVEVMDAHQLERTFSPLELERPDDWDVVIPIQAKYVKQLFPSEAQATLSPRPIGLRTTNVYYKAARNDGGLRRGARLLFYESDDDRTAGRGIIGYAQLISVHLGSPKKLHALHGGLGAWTEARIAEHTHGDEGAAYRFTGYRALQRPVPLDEVRAVHAKYNPITTYRIQRSVSDNVLARGASP